MRGAVIHQLLASIRHEDTKIGSEVRGVLEEFCDLA